MKYMVMECHLSYAVVLDEQGNFIKAANLHYEVGQITDHIFEMNYSRPVSQKSKAKRWISALGALAACIIVVLTMVFQFNPKPYGTVYLSINPQVKIDVDSQNIVINLSGENEDGEVLTEGYDYQKKELGPVMNELTDRAIEMEYLKDGGKITLTLDSEDGEWVREQSDLLGLQLEGHLKSQVAVTIEVGSLSSSSNYGDSGYDN